MRGKALKNYGTVAALVVIIGIFGLLRPASFFTLKNFLNITRQAAPLAIIALGFYGRQWIHVACGIYHG